MKRHKRFLHDADDFYAAQGSVKRHTTYDFIDAGSRLEKYANTVPENGIINCFGQSDGENGVKRLLRAREARSGNCDDLRGRRSSNASQPQYSWDILLITGCDLGPEKETAPDCESEAVDAT